MAEIRALHAAAAAAAATAAEIAEEIVEDIREAAGEVMTLARSHGAVKRRMPEPVVGRTLLRVLENLVGFVDLPEPDLRGGIIGIAVRMVLHRKLAIRLLDGALVGIPSDTEHIIEILFRHDPGSCRSGQAVPLFLSSSTSSKSASTTPSSPSPSPAEVSCWLR